MKVLLLLFILFLLSFEEAQATLVIPLSLSSSDRGQLLQILGYGSACKILGDPFPLGGYSGLEVGISSEFLPTDKIATLGAKAADQSQTNYYVITFGKGLYYNIDTFLQFAPLGQAESVSSIGGQIRWGFYQAEYLPIYMAAVIHANSMNFENLITTSTMGFDLIAGFKAGDVTLYFGGGPIRAMGNFSGGIGGVTDSGITEGAGIADSRFLAGVNIKIDKFFVAAELDNYASAVYAAKLGYRF